MNYIKSILIILFLSSLFSNELLFLENSGFLIESKVIGDMESIYNEDISAYERKGLNLNNMNFSFYLKGNHRIDFKYFKNYDKYQGFNLPIVSEYMGFGSAHFLKNKTALKLNFSFSFEYIMEKENLFNKSRLGFGISKENENKDFSSFSQIMFFLEKRSNAESLDFLMRFDYPVSMQVLPKDNTPSKVFYVLTPSLIINRKDIYYSIAFSICRNFK